MEDVIDAAFKPALVVYEHGRGPWLSPDGGAVCAGQWGSEDEGNIELDSGISQARLYLSFYFAGGDELIGPFGFQCIEIPRDDNREV